MVPSYRYELICRSPWPMVGGRLLPQIRWDELQMPIKVTCKCGQSFAAKDQLAGKAVKCPKCAQPLRIPQPQAKPAAGQQPAAPAAGGLTDLLDEVGLSGHEHDDYVGPRCPSCDSPMAQNAALCVVCGFNLQTGEFVKGVIQKSTAGPVQLEGFEGAAESLLQKAAKSMRDDSSEEQKMRRQGMPAWLIAVLLAFVLTFMIGMSVLPRGQALMISGIVFIVALYIVATVANIMLIVIAFHESVAAGLMFMFVPFYGLYFVFSHWDDCKGLFFVAFFCGLAHNLGWVAIAMSDDFEDEPVQDSRLRAIGQPIAVASAPFVPGPGEYRV